MPMKWEFRNGEPIYQQIIRILQTKIAAGEYPAGSRVPAVRELAMEAGVNPNTMHRALAELERDGLLETVRTTGKYVTQDSERISLLREELAADSIDALIEGLRGLGLQDAKIIEEVKRRISGNPGKE